ncbi:hypothetical protein N431DRAFT_341225 [Stipitochalara longipes BDJ]|nr:hypothetical protein N431DRAFT_341225 [Stipitochalara longipes BDJ]
MRWDDMDDMDYFALDGYDPNQFKVKVLKDFCRGTIFGDVERGRGIAGCRRAIWLDERDNTPNGGTAEIRQHKNPLTATGLYRALEIPRFNNERLPHASRRLIYIADLDPACIRALAETASVHQSEGLRDAIYKYLTFQTSIEVKISSVGFPTFQLHLHIPFFILSKCSPPKASTSTIETKPSRRWTDLSFLRLDGLKSQAQDSTEVWGMQEAQISCVIIGTDDWRWVGYGFVDSEVDGLLDECDEEELQFDQIADRELYTHSPVQQPRNYWIRVFQIRIASIGKQWEHNLYRLQRAIDTHFTQDPARPSLSNKSERQLAEVEAAFDWTLKTLEILRRLTAALSDTLDAWAKFSAPGGDIGYFEDKDSNPQHSSNIQRLHTIRRVFGELEGVYKAFLVLNKRCADYISTVSNARLYSGISY